MSERGAALFSTRAMKWASWKVSFPPFPRQRLSVGRRSGGDGRSGGGKGRKKTKSSCFSPPVFFNVKVAWGSGWLAGGRARLACLLRRGMFGGDFPNIGEKEGKRRHVERGREGLLFFCCHV